jgi:hypothetical protein
VAAPPSGGFGGTFGGAPVAAPPSGGFGGTFGGAPVAAPPSGGFGGTFGGAPVAAPPSGGFGGTFGGATTPGSAPAVQVPEVKDLCLVLWDQQYVKEIKQAWSKSMRIVVEGPFPFGKDLKKVVMEEDTSSIDAASLDNIDKLWKKGNPKARACMEWKEGAPIRISTKVQDALNSEINKALKEIRDDSTEWPELRKQYEGPIIDVLKPIVAQRSAFRMQQLSLLETVVQEMKSGGILARKQWKIIKFCPRNDVLPFRVDAKVPGLGDTDECIPSAYVFQNPFAKR